MIRLEIIANHSVEENILEAMKDAGVGKFYTRYSNVFGVGSTGPRMGDAIWPEENFALIVWCEEDEARNIAAAVATVKVQFPDEGIKVFGLPSETAAPPKTTASAGPPETKAPAGLPSETLAPARPSVNDPEPEEY
jgi:hypothetical protein